MCLVYTSGLKIAEKDITVYKWLEKTARGKYQTPYFYQKVTENTKYTSDLKLDGGQVHEGLHSFKYKSYAISDSYICNAEYTPYVVKCTIPAGSEYYEGIYEGQKAYASDCIIYGRFEKI